MGPLPLPDILEIAGLPVRIWVNDAIFDMQKAVCPDLYAVTDIGDIR